MTSIRQLPPELQELAISKLNEDPKRIQKDISAIKEWLKKQPHLTCRSDDQWILSFLRGCKFSLERTKEKIDMHLTLKAMSPEIYSNRDPLTPELQEIFKAGVTVHLKNPDANGRAIILCRISQNDPKKHENLNITKCTFSQIDITLAENDRFSICGLTVILDCKGLSRDHILGLNLTVMKKAISCHLNGYPYPSQAVHCINAPSAFESVYNYFRSMNDNYKFYGTDLTEFYKEVPLAALPNEYGGDAGPIDELIAEWNEKVQSYRNWLIEDEKYKADEKKRKGRAKTSSEIFGIEGSFRTLNFE